MYEGAGYKFLFGKPIYSMSHTLTHLQYIVGLTCSTVVIQRTKADWRGFVHETFFGCTVLSCLARRGSVINCSILQSISHLSVWVCMSPGSTWRVWSFSSALGFGSWSTTPSFIICQCPVYLALCPELSTPRWARLMKYVENKFTIDLLQKSPEVFIFAM